MAANEYGAAFPRVCVWGGRGGRGHSLDGKLRQKRGTFFRLLVYGKVGNSYV